MRLFLSLPLPNHVAEHLQEAVHSVEAAAPQTPGNRRPALRWVPEEQRHITLAFYGEVPDGVVEDLSTTLEQQLGAVAPLSLRLRGAGVFSGQVLWAGVQTEHTSSHSSGTSPLTALMRLCEQAGSQYSTSGAPARERRRAHVTLARARDRRRAAEQLQARAAALSIYEGPSWRADQAHLMLSELGAGTSGGPQHTLLDRVQLRG